MTEADKRQIIAATAKVLGYYIGPTYDLHSPKGSRIAFGRVSDGEYALFSSLAALIHLRHNGYLTDIRLEVEG